VTDAPEAIPLADFVAALRTEIKAAHSLADPDLPIELGPVHVEFTLLTRREASGRAGIRFWVVDAGATASRTSESTQQVTLELIPLGPGGIGRARVRDIERD
jgi:hypothetical protein